MLKSSYFFLAYTIFLTSCTKTTTSSELDKGFVVALNFEDTQSTWVFLNKIVNDSVVVVDSSFIDNKKSEFRGAIDYPKRYFITLNNETGKKMIILDNDTIQLSIEKNNLGNAIISGSHLNNELQTHQKRVQQAFKKVNTLFPEMQRARLANDAEKLLEIRTKIEKIEQDALELNFDYVQNYPTSFLSPMILNDLSKRDSIDITRIKRLYKALSSEVQESFDAKELEQHLQTISNH